jgi:hypothetical protein
MSWLKTTRKKSKLLTWKFTNPKDRQSGFLCLTVWKTGTAYFHTGDYPPGYQHRSSLQHGSLEAGRTIKFYCLQWTRIAVSDLFLRHRGSFDTEGSTFRKATRQKLAGEIATPLVGSPLWLNQAAGLMRASSLTFEEFIDMTRSPSNILGEDNMDEKLEVRKAGHFDSI